MKSIIKSFKLADLKGVGKVAITSVKKYAPQILTSVGVVGLVTTSVMSVRVTPKALEAINAEKERRQKMADALAEVENAKPGERVVINPEPIKPLEYVQLTWKLYLPSVGVGLASIACIAGANHIFIQRNAALAAAYMLTENRFDTYKEKAKEVLGDKKEKTIRSSIAESDMKSTEMVEEYVAKTGRGDTRCFDCISGRYFDSDVDDLKRCVNELNHQMLFDETVTLNDFYELANLELSRLGDNLGWNRNQHGLVELSFDSKLADDGTPVVTVDFINGPYYTGIAFMSPRSWD